MTQIPATHITEAHKLTADGEVELFQLSPLTGGTLYFKPQNTVTWLGNEYVGLPVAITGMKKSAEKSSNMPRLVIGEENIDLSMFKPLLNDGHVDGATLIYMRVLLANLVGNLDIKEQYHFRVKRPENYSRSRISLALSSASDAMNFTLPGKQYYPPAFPAVMIE